MPQTKKEWLLVLVVVNILLVVFAFIFTIHGLIAFIALVLVFITIGLSEKGRNTDSYLVSLAGNIFLFIITCCIFIWAVEKEEKPRQPIETTEGVNNSEPENIETPGSLTIKIPSGTGYGVLHINGVPHYTQPGTSISKSIDSRKAVIVFRSGLLEYRKTTDVPPNSSLSLSVAPDIKSFEYKKEAMEYNGNRTLGNAIVSDDGLLYLPLYEGRKKKKKARDPSAKFFRWSSLREIRIFKKGRKKGRMLLCPKNTGNNEFEMDNVLEPDVLEALKYIGVQIK